MLQPGVKPVILCIDDYASAAAVRKTILEMHGYAVILASSGEEGLEIVRTEKVDLVVSDHYLQGKTGGQIAREMKTLRPEMPIVLLSGAVERPEGSEYADAFVCKAECREVLFETIASLLKQPKALGAAR
jgi:CheY-like chemotaxis protein